MVLFFMVRVSARVMVIVTLHVCVLCDNTHSFTSFSLSNLTSCSKCKMSHNKASYCYCACTCAIHANNI